VRAEKFRTFRLEAVKCTEDGETVKDTAEGTRVEFSKREINWNRKYTVALALCAINLGGYLRTVPASDSPGKHN
jgi:hypothetical protein